jgi:hypothetical protein
LSLLLRLYSEAKKNPECFSKHPGFFIFEGAF